MNIKKFIKATIVSANAIYLIQILSIVLGFLLLHVGGVDLGEFITMLVIAIPQSFLYGLFLLIILYSFAPLENRILDLWFIVFFASYSFIVSLILNNTWLAPWFYQLGFILISLMIIIRIMNVKKWIKK